MNDYSKAAEVVVSYFACQCFVDDQLFCCETCVIDIIGLLKSSGIYLLTKTPRSVTFNFTDFSHSHLTTVAYILKVSGNRYMKVCRLLNSGDEFPVTARRWHLIQLHSSVSCHC